jgi:diguanylate cyclase (GGDEF)-like protein
MPSQDEGRSRTPAADEPLDPARLAMVVLLGIVSLALLGVLDHVSGVEISFSIFYLAPIGWVAWVGGRRPAVAIAVAAAIVWALVDRLSGRGFSHPLIPLWNSFVRFGFFFLIAWLVSDVRGAHLRERRLARRDALTGVANARSLLEALERERTRMQRTGAALTLAYVDLDRFKAVNDTLGHAAGDRLLREIALALGSTLRAVDVVARLGGDEFAVLLPETDTEAARVALGRCLESVRARVRAAEGIPEGVGATIGAVVFRKAPHSAEVAIRAADDRMYAAKHSGRDQVSVVTADEAPAPASAL